LHAVRTSAAAITALGRSSMEGGLDELQVPNFSATMMFEQIA
jgi:hypothetical protein